MRTHAPQILYALFACLLWAGCAQIGPLTGGKKDTTAPVMVQSVPQNQALNFKGEEIVLRFNEYVQVKDLTNQMIITPVLKNMPDITASGKIVTVSFKDSDLRPNTTYRFYFGNAIADMNESNSIPNFEFVFSTGSYLDTLMLNGKITDALSNKPPAGILVALFSNHRSRDSLPLKYNPDYITRTDDKGEFTLRNLPADTFRVFSYDDKNKNLLFDGASEKVSFLSDELKLRSDSSIKMYQFQEEVSKGFVKDILSPFYGMTHIILNKRSLVDLRPLSPAHTPLLHETRVGKEKDTVTVFYRDMVDTLKVVLNNISSRKTDTLRIKLPSGTRSAKKLKTFSTNADGGVLPLGQNLQFRFLTWMDTTIRNTSGIKVTSSDSLSPNPLIGGRWKDITTFEFAPVFKEDTRYTLKTDTGTFFDMQRITNDSSKITFKRQNKLEFGKVTLKMTFNKKQSYVIQLVNEELKTIKEQNVSLPLSASNAVSLDFTDIPPGTYLVRTIFDDNENKKWDTGNVLQKKQPEQVIIHSKQLKVLADWEIEEEFQVKE